jgi:hypothetical protein
VDRNAPVPVALHGTTARLRVVQELLVADGRCETRAYQYHFLLGEEKGSWLIRWEYFRQHPRLDYPYPLAHVHMNGQFTPGAAVALPKLHVPTRRIPLELVLWHLVAEWGVKPKQDDWRGLLEESIDGFERRRRAP